MRKSRNQEKEIVPKPLQVYIRFSTIVAPISFPATDPISAATGAAPSPGFDSAY